MHSNDWDNFLGFGMQVQYNHYQGRPGYLTHDIPAVNIVRGAHMSAAVIHRLHLFHEWHMLCSEFVTDKLVEAEEDALAVSEAATKEKTREVAAMEVNVRAAKSRQAAAEEQGRRLVRGKPSPIAQSSQSGSPLEPP